MYLFNSINYLPDRKKLGEPANFHRISDNGDSTRRLEMPRYNTSPCKLQGLKMYF